MPALRWWADVPENERYHGSDRHPDYDAGRCQAAVHAYYLSLGWDRCPQTVCSRDPRLCTRHYRIAHPDDLDTFGEYTGRRALNSLARHHISVLASRFMSDDDLLLIRDFGKVSLQWLRATYPPLAHPPESADHSDAAAWLPPPV